jgi:uncharacterized membrane protein
LLQRRFCQHCHFSSWLLSLAVWGSFLVGQDSPTSLVFGVMVGAFLPPLIGLGLAIWTTIRSVVGLNRLKDGKPIDNPTTWTI